MIYAMQDVFSVVFKSTRPDMMSKTSLKTQLTPPGPQIGTKVKRIDFLRVILFKVLIGPIL